MIDTSVDSRIEQQKFKESAQLSEKYYPITEKEILTFVQHSSQIDRETRSLAQEIYSRGMVSLSGDVALIKDLNYEIYKLKNKISEYDVRNNQMREEGAKAERERIQPKLHSLFECIKKHWGEHHEAPVYQYNLLVKTLDEFEQSIDQQE